MDNQGGFGNIGFGPPPQMTAHQGPLHQVGGQQGNPYAHAAMNSHPSHVQTGQHNPPNNLQTQFQSGGNFPFGMIPPHGQNGQHNPPNNPQAQFQARGKAAVSPRIGQNGQDNLPNGPQLRLQAHGKVDIGMSSPPGQNGQNNLPNNPQLQFQAHRNFALGMSPLHGQNGQYNQPRPPQMPFQPHGNVLFPPGQHPYGPYNCSPYAQYQVPNPGLAMPFSPVPHAHGFQPFPHYSQPTVDRNGFMYMVSGFQFTTNPNCLPGTSNRGTAAPETKQYHFIEESGMFTAPEAVSTKKPDRLPSSSTPQPSKPKIEGTVNAGTTSPKAQQGHDQPQSIGHGNMHLAPGGGEKAESILAEPFEPNLPGSSNRKSRTHTTATHTPQANSQPQFDSNGSMHMTPGSGQRAPFSCPQSFELHLSESKKRKATNDGIAQKMAPGQSGQKDEKLTTSQPNLEGPQPQSMRHSSLTMKEPEPKKRKTSNQVTAENMASGQEGEEDGGIPTPQMNLDSPQTQSMPHHSIAIGGTDRPNSASVTSNSDRQEFTDQDSTPPNQKSTPTQPKPTNLKSGNLSGESKSGHTNNPSSSAGTREPQPSLNLGTSSGGREEPVDSVNSLSAEPREPGLSAPSGGLSEPGQSAHSGGLAEPDINLDSGFKEPRRPDNDKDSPPGDARGPGNDENPPPGQARQPYISIPSQKPTPLPPSLPLLSPPHMNSPLPKWGKYQLTANDALYATTSEFQNFKHNPVDWNEAAAELHAEGQPAIDMDAFVAKVDPGYLERQKNQHGQQSQLEQQDQPNQQNEQVRQVRRAQQAQPAQQTQRNPNN